MRRKGTALLALGMVLTLTGCVAAGTGADAPTPARVVTPTPTPTPTVMTATEAGAKYLSIVCPVNLLIDPLQAAYNKQNLKDIKQIAAKARDRSRAEAVALSEQSTWPDAVKPQLKILSDASFAHVALYDQIAAARTLDEANSVIFDDSAAGAAAQKVRALLKGTRKADEAPHAD